MPITMCLNVLTSWMHTPDNGRLGNPMRDKIMTIKFKFMHPSTCGEVTMRIREGEAFHYHHGQRTEEGWESLSITWRNVAGRLVREYVRRAQDCDGRMDWYGEDIASAAFSGDLLLNHSGYPRWEEIDSSQRDYEAEKAGY
jgi:hypothetical protein